MPAAKVDAREIVITHAVRTIHDAVSDLIDEITETNTVEDAAVLHGQLVDLESVFCRLRERSSRHLEFLKIRVL